jgi:DNA-binding response OmpR family regulator
MSIDQKVRPRLVIVEDELPQQLVINKALEHDYDLKFISTYKEALAWIPSQEVPDCIIMDIMLDEADGFELCALMKTYAHLRHVPIIFLSSNSLVSSKILGFSLGANDYLIKPCDPIELRTRVQARINEKKHYSQVEAVAPPSNQVFGLVQFDLLSQRVVICGQSPNEQLFEIRLTPLEFKMFLYMAKKEGRPVPRTELLEEVWGKNHHVIPRTIDTFVAGLRKKLGPFKHIVKSVHGVGYKFNPVSANSKVA